MAGKSVHKVARRPVPRPGQKSPRGAFSKALVALQVGQCIHSLPLSERATKATIVSYYARTLTRRFTTRRTGDQTWAVWREE